MGLLSRAADSTDLKPASVKNRSSSTVPEQKVPILDEAGKALIERIKKLPEKSGTPYTALSLLKTYAAFQVGMCLSLEKGNYTSYASMGVGFGKITIPRNNIWTGEKVSGDYFRIDSSENLAIKTADKTLFFWGFPLDSPVPGTGKPWEAIMILGVSNPEVFNPEAVAAILNAGAGKFHTEEKGAVDNSEEDKVIKRRIAQYQQIHADFNCILLESPSSVSQDKDNFCEKVSNIINTAGAVIPLSTGRPLILLPIAKDRELITHRLSKTLRTNVLLSFEADSPEDVFSHLYSLH